MMTARERSPRRAASAGGWLAGVLVLGLLGCTAPERPHVLVVLIDALRADHLGTYGYPRPTSPHIDALASESLVFRNSYAHSPWTKPSVPTLFTSLYPIQHGVYEGEAHGSSGAFESDMLADEFVTLAEAFQSAGYRTAGFVHNAHLRGEYGFAQGFDVYQQGDLDAREINRRFIEFLAAGDERPFFAYLHYLDVHWPFQPREPYRSRFPGADGDGVFSRPSWRGLRNRINDGALPLSERDVAQLVALHDGGIAQLDHRIGELLGTLRERGLLEQTVVLLTSDHGEELLDHGQVGHGGTLYREVIEIPLMIRLPGLTRRGIATRPARLLDVSPTLLDAAGIPAPPAFEGRSLLARSEANEDPEILAETRHKRSYQVSVRRGDWKYVRRYRAPRGGSLGHGDPEGFGLAPGMRVKAKGDFEPDGTLYAHKVSIKDSADDDVELSGPVESVDANGHVFAIHGLRIDSRELIEADGSALGERLAVGEWLKVEGHVVPGRGLAADEFERLPEPERETELEGIIQDLEVLSRKRVLLEIGGVAVLVTADTRIKGSSEPSPSPIAEDPEADPFTPERLRSGEGLTIEEQLFHLATDPREQNDVAPREPERLAELRGELLGWFERMGASGPRRAARTVLDDDTVDQLRELGYIE